MRTDSLLTNDELWCCLHEVDQRCRAAGGVLTAEAVVDAATDPETLLHGVFQWHVGPENHRRRLIHARELIEHCRSVASAQPVPYVRPGRKGNRVRAK